MRLDRFLSNFPRFSRQDSRLLVSAGRVRVDGAVVRDPRSEVRDFQRVELDDELLQAGRSARYWMLHKPVGVVSATEHEEHRTVLDLLDETDPDDLDERDEDEPAGDLGLLVDLGVAEEVMEELIDDVDLYPDEALSSTFPGFS